MALQVWLPLNGNLENRGLSNVTATNNGATVNASGKTGSCYQFGTASSYMTVPASAMSGFTSECSVCFWVNILSWNTAYATFFQAGKGSSPWNNYIFAFLRNNQNSSCVFTISDTSGTSSTSNYSTSVMSQNTWYHVALTYTTGTVRIYLNGSLDHSYSTSVVPGFSSITTITLGKCNNLSSYQTNCLMNDLRIYDHCLSSQEVKEISRGLVLHYKLDSISNLILPKEYKQLEYIESTGTQYLNLQQTITSSTGIIVDMQLSYPVSTTHYPIWCVYDGTMYYEFFVKNGYLSALRWGNRSEVVPSPSDILFVGTNRVYSDVYKGVYKLNGRIAWTGNTSYTSTTTKDICIFRYIKSDGTIDSRNTTGKIYFIQLYGDRDVYLIPAKRISDGAIGMYDINSNTFYNNAGTGTFTAGPEITSQIRDCSGYENNGDITGALSITTNSPRYESSVLIGNGVSNYIKSPTVYTGDNAITMNIWVKSTNTAPTGNYHMPFEGENPGYGEMSIYKTGYLRGGLYVNGTRYVTNSTSTVLLDGNWHMITMTYDGSAIRRYIDAVLDNSTTVSGTLTNTNQAYYFGRYGTNSSYGSIDMELSDARLYATALSDADIADLYHTSAIVDNLGNLHIFEVKEDDSTPEIMETGDAVANNFLEIGNRIKTLSDGSVWLHVLHHGNPASNLFTAANCWNYDNGSTLYSALWLLKNEEWKYNGKYELLVCEKLTSSSSEAQYRWTQTSNPSTSSSITGFTVISGSGTYFNRGLLTNGNYGAMHNGNTWWCCCGSYTAYQGGIPGMNGVVTTGCLDLYIRITQDIFKNPESDLFSIYETGYVQNELIEI